MTTAIGVFVLIIAGCAWIAAIVLVAVMATDRGSWLLGLASACILAAPVAIVVALASGDANSNRLCLAGHQEWRTSHRSPALVGKVIVPGGTSTHKAWVCDRWEN